jgi:hypothetical protein
MRATPPSQTRESPGPGSPDAEKLVRYVRRVAVDLGHTSIGVTIAVHYALRDRYPAPASATSRKWALSRFATLAPWVIVA